ncbi:hypothetical protein SGLAM104S_03167 [Streptomyces glaucescens]
MAAARRAAREPGRGASRPPAKPNSAGSRVTATRTAISTVAAALRPITVRKGMRTTASPTSAMITVVPANTTALPAVPTARPADSRGSMPWASWVRCRDSTKRA